jgi:hypothetical protein
MKKTEMFVTVYRLQVEATRENLDSMENFIEAISDCAIVPPNDEGCVAIIVASSDALGTTKLANMALKFFGKEGYNISTLGLLGPFKKLN